MALTVTRGSELPIVYSGMVSPAAAGLDCHSEAASRLTGTSMEVPVAEQLQVFMLARPGLQRLGILFCTATPEAVATGRAAETAARDLGLRVITAMVTDERRELLDKAVTTLQEERPCFCPLTRCWLPPGTWKSSAGGCCGPDCR